MENTIENKEKFFGIYLGANICDWEDYKLEGIKGKYSTFLGKRNEIDVWVKTSALSLLLKPLSSISDEDRDICISLGETHKRNFNQKQIDFLRSKGYAVDWMDLSVEDLQNYGWIKLAE